MNKIKHLAIISVVILAACSCRKIEKLSPIPHIEFRSFSVFDSIDPLGNFVKGGRLKFYFEDGDGDLGLKSSETELSDTIDLFFDSFRKISGSMVHITDSTDPVIAYKYTIPYMERQGVNKILKGIISVSFLYLYYEPRDSDIIRYDFHIKDRAENMSDTVSTCEIPLSKNGLYEY
jgi:hypothetical protein